MSETSSVRPPGRPRLPPLNSLRAFEAAARLESFRDAARELHVTPTAISHQIRGLEDKLGVRLFQRQTRRVVLTDQGVLLAAATRDALDRLAEAMAAIGAARSMLTVSTTAAFAALWLVPKLSGFHAGHPSTDVRIHTSEQPEDLDHGSIDAAIRYLPSAPAHADGRVLARETFGAYVNPARRGRRRRLRSLLDDLVLIETRWRSGNLPAVGWRQWLDRFAPGVTGARIVAFDQEHHAIGAAMAGEGVVLASSVLVETAVQHGWLAAVEPDHRLPGFTYCWVTARSAAGRTKVFGDWLASALDG